MSVLRIGFVTLWILSAVERTAAAQHTLWPAWSLEGNQSGAGFGSAVAAAGDVDGDGHGDVLVAAYRFEDDQIDEGRAFLYLGSKHGLAKVPSWTAESDQAFATMGAVAGAGDVNDDGYDDVLVSSYLYSNDQYLEGRAWLYLGSAAGLATTPAWSVEGDALNVNLGSSIAGAGDVNGDGYDDVLIGVAQYSDGQQSEGAVFLYLGSPAGLATSAAWFAEGNQRFSGFGRAGSAGDVNGDGYGDVIVGASSFNNGELDEGRAYLYLGSPAGLAATPAWSAEGNQAGASFGFPAGSAGDVNGDGYGDVVVGALGYHTPPIGLNPEGRAFLYLGSAGGLSALPAWSASGTRESELFGVVAAAGDLDGDGHDDVLVGAYGYRNGQRNEGRVQAYFGSPTGLAPLAGWSFESNQRDATLGFPLAAAGDVNADGFADVIVAAPLFDNGQQDEGRAYLFQGSDRRRLR